MSQGNVSKQVDAGGAVKTANGQKMKGARVSLIPAMNFPGLSAPRYQQGASGTGI
jgi:hypothetical protein